MPKLIEVTKTLGLIVVLARLDEDPTVGGDQRERDRQTGDGQRVRRPALRRGRGGRDREAEHEQRADHLSRRGDGEREHEQEDETEPADGHTARGRHVGVDRREQQRPVHDSAITTTTPSPMATSARSWSLLTPKMLPKRMFVAAVAKPW